MRRVAPVFTALILLGTQASVRSDEKPAKKAPDGVYAVLRESQKEKDVLPLKEGEALVVNRHRYLKDADKEPPRYVVIRSTPDVMLDLAGKPKAVKDGDAGIRILLKLQPKAAAALERVTQKHEGRPLAIVLGGEVVTQHKIRGVIRGGDVQITSCAPGGAEYLLEKLEALQKK